VLNKILLAYDGSTAAIRAFDFALQLAARFGSKLVVLSVVQLPEPATMVESTAMVESATEHFNQSIERLRTAASSAGVDFSHKIVVGHPSEQIVHAADVEKADLIVMGHRGKSMVQRWLLGSVSKRVITYAPCSVTIVR